MAYHLIENGHDIDKDDLKLVKVINSSRELDAYNSLYASQYGNLMNRDTAILGKSGTYRNYPYPTSPQSLKSGYIFVLHITLCNLHTYIHILDIPISTKS